MAASTGRNPMLMHRNPIDTRALGAGRSWAARKGVAPRFGRVRAPI